MYFCNFVIIYPWKRACPFIWTNLNPLHPCMLCAKYGWNWPSGYGEKDFYISSIYFHYFEIISFWKRGWPFIWTNLNSLYPKMHCVKFGWKKPSGSGEEVKKWEKFKDEQTDRCQTTGDQKSLLDLSAQVSYKIWGIREDRYSHNFSLFWMNVESSGLINHDVNLIKSQ